MRAGPWKTSLHDAKRGARRLIEADALGEVFSGCFRLRTGDGWPEDAYLARQPFFRDYVPETSPAGTRDRPRGFIAQGCPALLTSAGLAGLALPGVP
jgi:hypothetical protein